MMKQKNETLSRRDAMRCVSAKQRRDAMHCVSTMTKTGNLTLTGFRTLSGFSLMHHASQHTVYKPARAEMFLYARFYKPRIFIELLM